MLILILGLLFILAAFVVAISWETRFDECASGDGHCITTAPCRYDGVHPDLCCYCSAPLGKELSEE